MFPNQLSSFQVSYYPFLSSKRKAVGIKSPKKLKMIEGNLGKRIKPRHGPGLIKRTKYNEGSVVHGGPKVMPSIRLYNSAWEMNRTTPYDDRVVVIINID